MSGMHSRWRYNWIEEFTNHEVLVTFLPAHAVEMQNNWIRSTVMEYKITNFATGGHENTNSADGHVPTFRAQLIYEQVAEQIRQRIYNGEFAPESRLPSERDLAALFGVSRPAVREAIGSLQNQDLVFTKRGSGTYVSKNPVSGNVSQMTNSVYLDDSPVSTLEVRLMLEPAIARMAARKANRSKEAERLLNEMARVIDIDDPQQQLIWTESDRLFHRELAAMTGDNLLVRIADQIAQSMEQPLWQRLRDDGIYDSARIGLYVAEHRLIYEAIIDGDEDAAAFYVEQHLKRVGKDITSSPSR